MQASAKTSKWDFSPEELTSICSVCHGPQSPSQHLTPHFRAVAKVKYHKHNMTEKERRADHGYALSQIISFLWPLTHQCFHRRKKLQRETRTLLLLQRQEKPFLPPFRKYRIIAAQAQCPQALTQPPLRSVW